MFENLIIGHWLFWVFCCIIIQIYKIKTKTMKMKILFAVLGVALIGAALYFGNGSLFQGKIAQADADLTVEVSSTQMQVKNASAGEKDVTVAEFVFKAGKNDVKIKKVALYPALEGTKIHQYENVRLIGQNGNIIAGPVSPVKANTFNLVGDFVVSKQTAVIVKVVSDIKSDVVGDSKFILSFRGGNAVNMTTGKTAKVFVAKNTKGSVVEVKGVPEVVIVQPKLEDVLSVTLSEPAYPGTYIVETGGTKFDINGFTSLYNYGGLELGKFVFQPKVEDLLLKSVTFDVGSGISLANMWLTTTENHGVSLVGGKAVFNNLNFTIDKNIGATLPVYGQIASIAEGAKSGEVFKVKLSEIEVVGASSGESYKFSLNTETDYYVVRKVRPLFKHAGASIEAMTNGYVQLSGVEIDTSSTESPADLDLGRMTFKVVKNGSFSISNLNLSSTPGVNTPIKNAVVTYQATNDNEGLIKVEFTDSEIISAPKKFYLFGLISNTVTGDTLAVTFDATGDITETKKYSELNGNFVWSDMTSANHSKENADWTNGRFPSTFPPAEYVTTVLKKW